MFRSGVWELYFGILSKGRTPAAARSIRAGADGGQCDNKKELDMKNRFYTGAAALNDIFAGGLRLIAGGVLCAAVFFGCGSDESEPLKPAELVLFNGIAYMHTDIDVTAEFKIVRNNDGSYVFHLDSPNNTRNVYIKMDVSGGHTHPFSANYGRIIDNEFPVRPADIITILDDSALPITAFYLSFGKIGSNKSIVVNLADKLPALRQFLNTRRQRDLFDRRRS